jgi:hypothetical protein
MSPPTSSGPSSMRRPLARTQIDVRRVPVRTGARRRESALVDRNEHGSPARFPLPYAWLSDTTPRSAGYGCYCFLTQLRSARHVVPRIDHPAPLAVSESGPGLGQHPRTTIIYCRRATRSVGAFTRSVHLATVQSSSAGSPTGPATSSPSSPSRPNAATRRADCRASGYPLCERHRALDGRCWLSVIQGQVDLITFG